MFGMAWKRVFLVIFALTIIVGVPITITVVATKEYTEKRIYEIEQFDNYQLHELYKNKWNYCPNCGERLKDE